MNRPTPAADTEPSHEAMEQAASWYALLRSGEATGKEREAWQTWLHDREDNRHAWGYVEAVSQRFSPIQTTAAPRQAADSIWSANTRTLQRRRVLTSIATLAGAGLLGWGSWQHTSLPVIARSWRADHRTATGERREVTLTDNTHVWLNTATAISENFDDRQRRLQLITGEILVDTASDTARRFVVDAPYARLTALGTRFTVHMDTSSTLLAVFEGAVEVKHAKGSRSLVEAGQQIRFDASGTGKLEPADSAREAWSRGLLVAQDIPLAQLVKELRRYRHGHLGVAPEIADLRVFGSFPLDDPNAALDLLAYALPVRIQRTLPWWTSLEVAAPTE
ncbi:FecR domain-containing protein [Cellvibrio polysaccharolyticus]|nr:FecR domain-containing protein [Cellvibrio polysaccharolyticus]